MFVFRLEPVLKHRKYQEELVLKEIAQLQQQIDDRKSGLQEVTQDMHRSIKGMRRLQSEGITISEQLMYSQYIDSLKIRIRQIEMELERLGERLDSKREELMEAVNRRKMIEKIKENRSLSYWEELLRTEQKLIDEAAVCRYKVGSAAIAH